MPSVSAMVAAARRYQELDATASSVRPFIRICDPALHCSMQRQLRCWQARAATQHHLQHPAAHIVDMHRYGGPVPPGRSAPSTPSNPRFFEREHLGCPGVAFCQIGRGPSHLDDDAVRAAALHARLTSRLASTGRAEQIELPHALDRQTGSCESLDQHSASVAGVQSTALQPLSAAHTQHGCLDPPSGSASR